MCDRFRRGKHEENVLPRCLLAFSLVKCGNTGSFDDVHPEIASRQRGKAANFSTCRHDLLSPFHPASQSANCRFALNTPDVLRLSKALSSNDFCSTNTSISRFIPAAEPSTSLPRNPQIPPPASSSPRLHSRLPFHGLPFLQPSSNTHPYLPDSPTITVHSPCPPCSWFPFAGAGTTAQLQTNTVRNSSP